MEDSGGVGPVGRAWRKKQIIMKKGVIKKRRTGEEATPQMGVRPTVCTWLWHEGSAAVPGSTGRACARGRKSSWVNRQVNPGDSLVTVRGVSEPASVRTAQNAANWARWLHFLRCGRAYHDIVAAVVYHRHVSVCALVSIWTASLSVCIWGAVRRRPMTIKVTMRWTTTTATTTTTTTTARRWLSRPTRSKCGHSRHRTILPPPGTARTMERIERDRQTHRPLFRSARFPTQRARHASGTKGIGDVCGGRLPGWTGREWCVWNSQFECRILSLCVRRRER